jgi:hypothetical protein
MTSRPTRRVFLLLLWLVAIPFGTRLAIDFIRSGRLGGSPAWPWASLVALLALGLAARVARALHAFAARPAPSGVSRPIFARRRPLDRPLARHSHRRPPRGRRGEAD